MNNKNRQTSVNDIKENLNRYEKQDSVNNMFFLFYQIIYLFMTVCAQ
jgi:hypothetical protein